jgi:PAS domain S-box-containing protein
MTAPLEYAPPRAPPPGSGGPDLRASPMTPGVDPRLFQLLAERVQDYAIFLLDREGRIASWNAGAEKIKQYRADEVIGKHFSVFYPPADIARQWPEHELKLATREGRFEDEGWRLRKDGSRFWANVVITALRDEAGSLLAFSKITRDLTGRRNQEESLRQSEERFRLLVDGVLDYAIYMLSPDGVVTSWNAGARRIKGYEASEIMGMHFSRFYTPEAIEAGKPWAELALAREHGRAEDEGWRVRKDGSRFWARVVVSALYDADGVLRGFAKVTQDLTQRRLSESLAMSTRALNDFIAVLAHELRNPLAPIRNAVELLRTLDGNAPLREKARLIIDRQSAQLVSIVDDLVDVNRITRGNIRMTEAPCDIVRIVKDVVDAVRPAIERAGQVLTVDLPAAPLPVLGDEARLVQALTNVLSNANRYTDPGGHIFVSASRVERGEHGSIRVSVRDDGRGIDPTFLHSIFDMFVQGKDSLHRPAAGLGVGLALAKSIVELQHGTIEARSEGLGKGAEFVVHLPELRDGDRPDAALAAQATASRPRGAPHGAERTRVLVVDDNVDAAVAAGDRLRDKGWGVVVVHGGQDALHAYEGFRPQVVLLDIGMPGMNGLDVAMRLRERDRSPRPYIVAVTGWNTENDRQRTKDAGFDLHLVKPVTEPQLVDMLNRATIG